MRKYLFLFCLLVSVQCMASDRYVDGARWAFVSDTASTTVAVIDTFNNQKVDMLKLQAIPTEMAVSDIQDLLVYIDGKTAKLFIYDLAEKTHGEMALEFVPDQIVFHSDGAQLAIGGKDKLVFVKPLQKQLFDEITDIQSPFSLNYDNGGYNLYITEQQSGKTLIYRLHDKQRTLVQLGRGKVSEITLSPDSRLGMVAQYDSNSVYIRDLFINQDFAVIDLPSTPYRPYVSSDSEHIILASENGQGAVVNAWSGEVERSITVGKKPQSLRSGWLETIGIVASNQALTVFDIKENTPEATISLSTPLNEVVVVSDSKTLFATQDKSTSLFVYDIRKAERLTRIETGLSQPNHMVMGITNTICH
ncbi:WD40 repeat domain-containing protein [Photobacterium sp. SDRW27]|uniref:YncE family protein n=1 Tax=Photobacterium obscurum TaxID=2829490 RepID=UPI002242F49B|nr:WD40 repeat domain-containing protein [Photobacterium obscurum]MCW8328381.1 WD40 repeat domain-containing protein [Photobacterium obscurum]